MWYCVIEMWNNVNSIRSIEEYFQQNTNILVRNKLREVFGWERLSANYESNPPHLITGLTVMWNWDEIDSVATWSYTDSSKQTRKVEIPNTHIQQIMLCCRYVWQIRGWTWVCGSAYGPVRDRYWWLCKVKFTLEQATKVRRGSRDIPLLLL